MVSQPGYGDDCNSTVSINVVLLPVWSVQVLARMINFHDPAELIRDFVTLKDLWHVVNGLYIWEFFTTLDYEWSIIQGRRTYRWTIWIYSVARLTTLASVILTFIGLDSTSPINCQAWATLFSSFGFIAVASSSLLIALRTIAIWNKNKLVLAFAIGTWLTNVGFLIHSVVGFRGLWIPVLSACGVSNLDSSKYNVITTLCTDIVLLSIMFIRLLQIRRKGGTPQRSMGRLLWTQGVIWFLLATLAQVPAAVFIALNLNDPFNFIFQFPALITVSIAATRIYRSLTDFGSYCVPQGGPRSTLSLSKPMSTSPIELSRTTVTVQTTSDQYPSLQATQYGMYGNKDEQLCDKPPELSVDDDLESGREKMKTAE